MDFSSRVTQMLVGGAVVLGLLAGAAVLFPRIVIDQFLWKYFWGPIVADNAGAATATYHGVVAASGYNIVNEVGYGLLLAYLLLLLIAVLKRFDVGTERGFVLAFLPFVVSGGLLRVVEDATATAAVSVPGPWQYLLISPVIYGTMVAIVFPTLLGGVFLERRGRVSNYKRVVAGVGAVFTAVLFTGLALMLPHNWWVGGAALGLASGVSAAAVLVSRFWPTIAPAVGGERGVVLFGHLVDGAATAVTFELVNPVLQGSVSWLSFHAANPVLVGQGYGEKHPLVQWFIAATGNAYFFVLLKLAVIGGILLYMNEAEREQDPLFFNLVLLAVLAIGLGPGTRTMMRAVFGV